MTRTFTILVPVYNEEQCLNALVDELKKFIEKAPIYTSILFINDGSTDNSLELIEEACLKNRGFFFISLQQRGGLSVALKAGIDHCNTTLIGYIDADLQTLPIDFLKLLEYADQYDLVMGYRQNRKDTLTKRITSTLANSLRRLLLKDTIIDTGCPLKIIKTDIAKRLPFYKGMHRFMPNMVAILGGKIKQIPIQHFPRYGGKSKYNFLNRFLGPVVDALALRWMQRNVIQYQIKKHNLVSNEEQILQNNVLDDTRDR
ncbi:glycosyltransferase [Solitalea sp. MAHUQ-68]|uniref:Glycosyltransferase n=1 Tax=Solitalea agri TaxID=2953739 RepID=A0A9X2F8E4_9SPHI|nr:glycosyltransferase [Solitalea agri]MCO4294226.1 glycosyltransferase [Solitalea agri]